MMPDLWMPPELPAVVAGACDYLHSLILQDLFGLLREPHGSMADYYERGIHHSAVRLAHLCRPILPIEDAVVRCGGCHRTRPVESGGRTCADCGDYLCPSCLDDDAPADDVLCHVCWNHRDVWAREHRMGVA